MKTVKGSTILGKIMRTTQSANGKTSRELEKHKSGIKTNEKTSGDNIIQFSKYSPKYKRDFRNEKLEENERIINNEQAIQIVDAIKIACYTVPCEIIEAQSKTKLVNMKTLPKLLLPIK